MAVCVLIWNTEMNSLSVVSFLEVGVMRNSGDGEEERQIPPTLSCAILVEGSWEITKLLGSFVAPVFQPCM